MLEEFEDVMTVEEACQALRMGTNALYLILNNGKLKAYRNGRVWRIPKQAVISYILENANLNQRSL